MKLETYIAYNVYRNENKFQDRLFEETFDTMKEAKEYAKENGCRTIMVECSVNLDNNVDGVSEFAYGKTITEAKKEMKALLKRVYGNEYTI